jgi:hypothetical protein
MLNRQYRVFIPYHNFQQCAGCLDTPELKAAQIAVLRILKYLKYSDEHQDKAEAWRGYEQSLIRYGIYVAEEYIRRGGNNKVLDYLKTLVVRGPWTKPHWVYDDNTLVNHRNHLLKRGLRRKLAKFINKQPGTPGSRAFARLCGYRTFSRCARSAILTMASNTECGTSSFYDQYNWNDNA